MKSNKTNKTLHIRLNVYGFISSGSNEQLMSRTTLVSQRNNLEQTRNVQTTKSYITNPTNKTYLDVAHKKICVSSRV